MQNNVEVVQDNFDRAAASYDTYAKPQKRIADYLAEQIQDHYTTPNKKSPPPPAPKVIVDVGTGTGYMLDHMQKTFPKAKMVVNDLSVNMLQQLAQKMGRGITRIDMRPGDAQTLDFTNHSKPYGSNVDLITSNMTVQWFNNLQDGLSHLWQQTNALAFSTLCLGSFHAWNAAHKKYNRVSNLQPLKNEAEILNVVQSLQQDLPNDVRVHLSASRKTFWEHYASPREFTDHLQGIGANTPNGHGDGMSRDVAKELRSGFDINFEVMTVVMSRYAPK